MAEDNACALDKLARQARAMNLTRLKATGRTFIFDLRLLPKDKE